MKTKWDRKIICVITCLMLVQPLYNLHPQHLRPLRCCDAGLMWLIADTILACSKKKNCGHSRNHTIYCDCITWCDPQLKTMAWRHNTLWHYTTGLWQLQLYNTPPILFIRNIWVKRSWCIWSTFVTKYLNYRLSKFLL